MLKAEDQVDELDEEQNDSVCRLVDPGSGIVVEMRIDGVPVGLALPTGLLDQSDDSVATAVLRTFVAANTEARELLERQAAED